MTVSRPRTLDSLGESAILREVLALLPPGDSTLLGPGDDAAVVAAPDGRVVATTDVLVEGRDFRRDWSSAADVGWKAAAQNLADIAAMGAVPTALLVALAAPGATEVQWALGLCEGLAAACAGTGAAVVGGDLSSASQVVVSVTALGNLEGREPLRRNGARPGDLVAVAGPVGSSAAGLELLDRGSPEIDVGLVAAHRRPRPPYRAGPAAADAGATALLDVSDGLLRDLGRIADASGVTIEIAWSGPGAGGLSVDAQTLAAAASALAPDPAAAAAVVRRWVLTGGEDHALAGTFPRDVVLPDGYRVVGEVLPRTQGGPSVTVDGVGGLDGPGGWDHFGG